MAGLGGSMSVSEHSGLRASSPGAEVSFSLSIVVPAYNEEASVQRVVDALLRLEMPNPLEIIAVDDGSSDRTGIILDAISNPRVVVIHHSTNQGKGSAVRSGIERASGSHVLIFDADHEYDPEDIPGLCQPLVRGRAEVVFGVRCFGHHTQFPSLVHAYGNRIMTLAANVLFGSAISDLHTCLKLLPIPLLRSMRLTERGFGLDTEISAEMLRLGFRPFEVPISYVGRSKAEGKKIRLRDAVVCFWVLIKVRLRGHIAYADRDLGLASSNGAQ